MMSEAERLTILKNLLSDTIKYANDDFEVSNRSLYDSYNQEPYGNEEEGRSQVIASDHFDMVESDMPSLARVFLGPNKILEFKAFGKQDAEEAEQKTKYADYLIREQRDSFKTLLDWMKEPGMAKCSVVKYFCEEKEEAEYVMYEGVSEDEAAVISADLEGRPKVDRVEIESTYDGDDEAKSIRFRVVRKKKKITIVGVPVNSFIISRGVSNKDEASVVGDECVKKKHELLADGIPEEIVKELPPNLSPDSQRDRQRRFAGQGGWDATTGYHWHNDEVTIQNLYVMMDVDEDGIPERRYIMKCGQRILEDEPYGIAPYAILSHIPIPHAAIGRSRGEQAARYQKEKTAVKRGIMDNIYSVNRPGHAVDASQGSFGGRKVDLDDLLTQRIGRIVRVDGDPASAIFPLSTEYVGDKALQVVQYIDNEKANTLGAMLTNQGLSSDKFYKETATRFEGVEEASQAKIELVSRVYAETGFRELYEGIIWTAQHYQDEETEIMVLGKPLIVDPRAWRYEHYTRSCIGLGAGDTADAIENLGVMLQTQINMIQMGLPLADSKKIFNTLDDMIRALGKPDISRYFNDPEIPEELLMAKLEQLFKENMLLQQQAQQNPLAEAELIKAKAKMAEVEGKETNAMRQFVIKMAQEDKQFAAELARDLTEMELKYQKDVPGSTV